MRETNVSNLEGTPAQEVAKGSALPECTHVPGPCELVPVDPVKAALTPFAISLNAHCRDLFSLDVYSVDGTEVFSKHDNYVPKDICVGGGDDVILTINIDTGQIIGWDAAKVRQSIAEMIADREERE